MFGAGFWWGVLGGALLEFKEVANGHFSIGIKTKTEQSRDKVGVHKIIAIDKGYIGASGNFETRVAGSGEATIGLVNDTNARVALSINITKMATHVSRAIINEDNF